jgi:predicted dehydrogenase
MSRQPTRRYFLQAMGAALTGGSALLAQGKQPPSERLHVGLIGVAGQGKDNRRALAAAGAEIVALCDVDEDRAAEARREFPRASFHADFRRLLDQKGLDAVAISTADHTHAVATVAALKAGLHVYCEKPLTHTVHEARIVAETAARCKRVTQLGTQMHAGDNFRRVVEIVRADVIGPVREVHVWADAAIGGGAVPKETPPVPAGLHYDLWLGPAAYRPYHPAYLPANWRGWWDFGGGGLGDMGCHFLDLPHWALGLRHPAKIAAEGPPVHPHSTPPWLIVRYEYPARDRRPAVKLTWYHGGKQPREYDARLKTKGRGVLFIGADGMLLANYDELLLLPAERFAGFKPPASSIPRSIGHHKEWVEACKSGGPTSCGFDYGGALTEAVLLGNVAFRAGEPIAWNAKDLKVTNCPAAERFLHYTYRKPWHL